MNKSNVDLINGPINSSLRQFAIPLAFSFIIQMLYAWVDMFYVSKLGSNAIAAIGVAEQILFFVAGIGIGFGIGAGIIVARRFGEGNNAEANQTAVQAFLLIFIVAVILSTLLFIFSSSILDLMNIRGEVALRADEFFRAIIFGIPFNFLVFMTNSIIRSTGNSKLPMLILIFSNILNMIIAPIFVFGFGPIPRLEIAGAGYATSISQFTTAALTFYFIFGRLKIIQFKVSYLAIDWKLIIKIVNLGIPASLQIVSISINRILLSTIANTHGTDILTTYLIGLRVDLLIFMSIFAVGVAIEVITSQNLGANKIKRIYQYHSSAIRQVGLLMILLGIIVFFFGKDLANVFIYDLPPSKKDFLSSSIDYYLKVQSFSYIFFAIGILSIRVISGAGANYKSLFLVVSVLFGIQIPLSFITSQFTPLKEYGIWYSILLSHVLFAAISYYFMKRGKWASVRV